MGSKFPLPPTLPEISLDLDEPGDDDSGTQPIAEAWDQALDEMHRAARRGDSERALHLGTRYLEQHGTNPSIELFVHELRGLVEARLTRTLALDRVVVLCRPLTEMSDATLDHRAGFLLAHRRQHHRRGVPPTSPPSRASTPCASSPNASQTVRSDSRDQ